MPNTALGCGFGSGSPRLHGQEVHTGQSHLGLLVSHHAQVPTLLKMRGGGGHTFYWTGAICRAEGLGL